MQNSHFHTTSSPLPPSHSLLPLLLPLCRSKNRTADLQAFTLVFTPSWPSPLLSLSLSLLTVGLLLSFISGCSLYPPRVLESRNKRGGCRARLGAERRSSGSISMLHLHIFIICLIKIALFGAFAARLLSPPTPPLHALSLCSGEMMSSSSQTLNVETRMHRQKNEMPALSVWMQSSNNIPCQYTTHTHQGCKIRKTINNT